jgi:hypothetical protein
MRCLACEWKSPNVSNLTFCPSCGLADQFYYYKADVDDASDEMLTCDTCHETYLFWQDADHKAFACG